MSRLRLLVLSVMFTILIQGTALARDTGDVATFELPGGAQIDMVWIEPGTFEMGDHFNEGVSEERPVHTVTLDGFWMGKYEVTNAEYCGFLNEQGNQSEGGDAWLSIDSPHCLITQSGGQFAPKSGYEDHSVIEVSWYGANAYSEWAGGRLPTEAEWEYAARGGLTGKRYPWGDDDPAGGRCNYWDYEGSLTSQMANLYHGRGPLPVGSFEPNGYGLHDMAGNVWEWCSDWYDEDYYSKSPASNPTGGSSGSSRVVRGGSWSSGAYSLRCAGRNGGAPDGGVSDVGFRLSKTASGDISVSPNTWGAIKSQF